MPIYYPSNIMLIYVDYLVLDYCAEERHDSSGSSSDLLHMSSDDGFHHDTDDSQESDIDCCLMALGIRLTGFTSSQQGSAIHQPDFGRQRRSAINR